MKPPSMEVNLARVGRRYRAVSQAAGDSGGSSCPACIQFLRSSDDQALVAMEKKWMKGHQVSNASSFEFRDHMWLQ